MVITSFYEWWLLRLPGVLIAPALLIDLEIFILLSSFLFLHLTLGLKTIVNDYLHNKKTKIIILKLIWLSNFQFLRYVLELLL